MTKKDKLLQRFLAKPKDLTWDEYVKVFEFLGFTLYKGDGSKRHFANADGLVFFIHEPHPSSIMKPYTIKNAILWFYEHDLLITENDLQTTDSPQGENNE